MVTGLFRVKGLGAGGTATVPACIFEFYCSGFRVHGLGFHLAVLPC